MTHKKFLLAGWLMCSQVVGVVFLLALFVPPLLFSMKLAKDKHERILVFFQQAHPPDCSSQ
jgi:hypothetical protein